MSDETTATERLRQLLDDRGVDWEAWNDRITVALPDTHYLEITDGTICAVMVDCTPEQAVNATLVSGTCHDTGMDRFECSGCGCTLDLEDAASCEPTMLVDGEAAVPRFCPNCGREVEQ